MSLRIAITGATGFLGQALVHRLLREGAEVHALSRQPLPIPGVHHHVYDLAGPVPAAVDTCDVVVHAAFAMGWRRQGRELAAINLTAARRLLACVRTNHRHMVFISSMSAHSEAGSSYGQTKWRIEQTLDPLRDTIVRPGLIIGPGGVYHRMLKSLRQAPIVPVFFGGHQPIQPIGLEDLVEGLVRIITRRLPGEFNLGSIAPITVRDLYRRMCEAQRLSRLILPLPGNPALWALRASEALHLPLPLTTENLLGQKHLRSFETSASLARLGLSLMPLSQLAWARPAPRA